MSDFTHRHLNHRPGEPIQHRGLAALDDVLYRGDLTDWRPLLERVRADPAGELADSILYLCDQHEMYGTSRLWRHWIEGLRAGVAPSPRAGVALNEFRRQRGLRQADVAARLGIGQPDVSKLESRSDLRLSTIRAYVEALGGRLRLIAVVDGHDLKDGESKDEESKDEEVELTIP